MENNQLIIYQTEDGKVKIEIHFKNDTVWLNQAQIGGFFKSHNQLLVSISKIHLKMENWKKKWLFGISEQPLNTVLLKG